MLSQAKWSQALHQALFSLEALVAVLPGPQRKHSFRWLSGVPVASVSVVIPLVGCVACRGIHMHLLWGIHSKATCRGKFCWPQLAVFHECNGFARAFVLEQRFLKSVWGSERAGYSWCSALPSSTNWWCSKSKLWNYCSFNFFVLPILLSLQGTGNAMFGQSPGTLADWGPMIVDSYGCIFNL